MSVEDAYVRVQNAVFADSEAVSTLLSFRQLEPTYSLTKDGPPGSHSMSSEGTEANKEEVAFKLTAAQEAWREKAALEWMGSEHMDMHGGRAVLPDEFLQNVLSSAAQGKLTSVDALEQETRWRRQLKYGRRGPRYCPFVFPAKSRVHPFRCEQRRAAQHRRLYDVHVGWSIMMP